MTPASRIVPLLFLSAVTVVTGGCLPDDAVADAADVAAADETLDSVAAQVSSPAVSEPQMRAQVDGLTVWIDRVARPVTRDGRRLWVLGGRASKDLAEVFSFVPDDAFATANLLSARKFELVFDSQSEINSILSGLPLYVRVTPRSGAAAFAGVWMAPRFARFAGSSRLTVKAPIETVWVAGELVYRGRVSSSAPYASLTVATADDSAPTVVAEAARHWKLDWSFDRLVVAADPPSDPVRFTGTSAAGARVEKRAGLDFAVTELRLTRDDPYDVWATRCEPEVHACLAALPAGQLDTEACGSYREVQWCGGAPVVDGEPDGAKLASGLRGYLGWWYESHGAEVLAAGGNPVEAAQAAVDAAKFERVTVAADDPHGHDLAQFWVYRHPDVVFPGSGATWFTVWDRVTGASVDTYDVR